MVHFLPVVVYVDMLCIKYSALVCVWSIFASYSIVVEEFAGGGC